MKKLQTKESLQKLINEFENLEINLKFDSERPYVQV